MNLLHAVDQPQSNIEDYVCNLDKILLDKIEMIGKLRQKLVTFYTHLRQEENLQKLYQEKQAGMFDGDGGNYGAGIN